MSVCVNHNRNSICDPGEPFGTLSLEFKRLATFSLDPAAFIESRCVHPVVDADGRFAGGFLNMRDVTVKDGEIKSTYEGDVLVTRVGQ